MQEIKYLCWDKRNQQMVKPSKINFGDDGSALTITVSVKSSEGYWYDLVHGESCELLQYTGIKDKNKVDIYEGSIIKIFSKLSVITEMVDQIMYKPSQFTFGYSTQDLDTLLYIGNEFEVIGNIYQNPELLS